MRGEVLIIESTYLLLKLSFFWRRFVKIVGPSEHEQYDHLGSWCTTVVSVTKNIRIRYEFRDIPAKLLVRDELQVSRQDFLTSSTK